jgi:hypothetical protein
MSTPPSPRPPRSGDDNSFTRKHKQSHSRSSSLGSMDTTLLHHQVNGTSIGDEENSESYRRRSAEMASPDVKRLMNAALMEMFEALGGEDWRRKHGWMMVGSRVSNWHGVEVQGGGISSVALVCNDLTGRIPASIGDIVMLQSLNLSYNQNITGWIPKSIGGLRMLKQLHLHSCSLEGRIPDELGSLRCLEELWLNGNRLTGPLPASFGKLLALRELYLNSNSLEGEIPRQWAALTHLESLNLSYNRLTGRFPDRMAATLIALRSLSLDGNDSMTDAPPPAETGPELTWWLGKKRLVYLLHVENKLQGLEKGWTKESAHLSLELERSRARIRVLEAQVAMAMGDSVMMSTGSTAMLPPPTPSAGRAQKSAIGLPSRGTPSADRTPPKSLTGSGGPGKQYRAQGRINSDDSLTVGLELLSVDGDSDSDAMNDDRSKMKKRRSIMGSIGRRFSTSRKDRDSPSDDSHNALREVIAAQLQNVSAPDVGDILGDQAPPPYSLAQFKDWAARNLLEENIDFYLDVQKIRQAKRRDVAGKAKLLVDMYITPGSALEVNVSSGARKAVLNGVRASLLTLAKNPRTGDVDPLREAFAPAEKEVLNLISSDAYPRFVNSISDVLQRFSSQQAVSELEVKLAKEFLELQRLNGDGEESVKLTQLTPNGAGGVKTGSPSS